MFLQSEAARREFTTVWSGQTKHATPTFSCVFAFMEKLQNVRTEVLFELHELGRWGKQHTNT